MLEGNTFFPETGTPMRKMACMSMLFALAEPLPLTVATFTTKSLVTTKSSVRSRESRSTSVFRHKG